MKHRTTEVLKVFLKLKSEELVEVPSQVWKNIITPILCFVIIGGIIAIIAIIFGVPVYLLLGGFIKTHVFHRPDNWFIYPFQINDIAGSLISIGSLGWITILSIFFMALPVGLIYSLVRWIMNNWEEANDIVNIQKTRNGK